MMNFFRLTGIQAGRFASSPLRHQSIPFGRRLWYGDFTLKGWSCPYGIPKYFLNGWGVATVNGLEGNVYVFGPYRLAPCRRTLSRNGKILPLAPKEFETLLVLVENGGEAVDKETIVGRVWQDTFVGDSSLTRNISVLRKALGEGVIETIPKFGYRLSLPVQVLKKEASKPTPFGSPPAESTPLLALRVRNTIRRIDGGAWIVGVLAVAMALGVGAYVHSRERQTDPGVASGAARVAVLPFLNKTGDSGQQDLCDGLNNGLISELSRQIPGRLEVIDRAFVTTYKATDKSAAEIGRRLKVHYVVEGVVSKAGNRLRVSTQLRRTSDARVIWTGEFERKLKDVLNMQHEMAISIARQIGLRLADRT
ncbi:MAG: winged helix-turn-helix domain-containing protein [Acidobacteriota bacterium]|nr:winged helix-turn-helix domain-containing protein [Acidobacteriota bacterium]